MNAAGRLEHSAGRPTARRRDSQATRRRLVDGIGTFAAEHGRSPTRLADVAAHVGVSTATAYRYFASIDDLANAHLARLPESAVSRFRRAGTGSTEPADVLHAWNRAWVTACLEFAPTTVPLRSALGFLHRWRAGDPLVTYVCDQVVPLLEAVGGDAEVGLAVWNVVSDPREVIDLRTTLGWSADRIARHVTRLTMAALGDPQP